MDEQCLRLSGGTSTPPDGTVCNAITAWDGQDNCWFESIGRQGDVESDDCNCSLHPTLTDCQTGTNSTVNPNGMFWRDKPYTTPHDCTADFVVPLAGVYWSWPNPGPVYNYSNGTQGAGCVDLVDPIFGTHTYLHWIGIRHYRSMYCRYQCTF